MFSSLFSCTSTKGSIQIANPVAAISGTTTSETTTSGTTANNDACTILRHLNTDDIKYFSFQGLTFDAKACNIYDGDTFSAVFVFRGEPIKYRCRCMGYDSPEMKPPLSKPNRDEEMKHAKIAKARFTELLQKSPDGLIKLECLAFEKYGRILVNVYNNVDHDSLNTIMVREGHGKAYDGGHKGEWDFDHAEK
jgi:endonuclease YncB( thermonuclease family)